MRENNQQVQFDYKGNSVPYQSQQLALYPYWLFPYKSAGAT